MSKAVRSAAAAAGFRVERGEGAESGTEVTVRGLAVPWGVETRLFGRVYERFERGSISPEAAGATEDAPYPARLNLDHQAGRSVASVAAGTLRFEDAEDGLRFEAVVDTRDSDANDLVVKLERGDYTDCSIEFDQGKGYKEERIEVADDKVLYSVKSVPKLWGVAVLAFGAYPTTSAEVESTRSLRRKQERGAERILDGVRRGVRRSQGLRMEREMLYDQIAGQEFRERQARRRSGRSQ